jgi:transcriptional regulator with XRE-family HTH domain
MRTPARHATPEPSLIAVSLTARAHRPSIGHRLDLAMGQRVRDRRQAIGMSQRELADALGITFQQVQKYERGTNRISFSRLVEIAGALNISIAELAAGLEPGEPSPDAATLNALRNEEGALEMLEAYAALPAEFRRPLIHHAREILRAAEVTGRPLRTGRAPRRQRRH